MNTVELVGFTAAATLLIFIAGILTGISIQDAMTIEECLKATAGVEFKKGEL